MRLATAVRNEVWGVDKDQPVSNVSTMEAIMAYSVARERFNMLLLAIFAGVALALAAVGIYGVMSYSVTQRTHEIGVRMALGATSTNVITMVVRQGMTLVIIGLAVGAAGAFALGRMMTALLFAVTPGDPLTFGAVAFVLIVVAAMSCLLPARRVTTIDPMLALRAE